MSQKEKWAAWQQLVSLGATKPNEITLNVVTEPEIEIVTDNVYVVTVDLPTTQEVAPIEIITPEQKPTIKKKHVNPA